LVIISESDRIQNQRYGNNQLRYAMIYVLITSVVLLFLNIYCAEASENLFSKSKEASMIEKAQLAAEEISSAEAVNASTVASAVSQMERLRATRLLVTDHAGKVLYDSEGSLTVNRYALFPEIIQALQGNDVFSWRLHSDAMESRAACPIISYGTLIGCVYVTEYDITQGKLMNSLQRNILTITIVLEVVVLMFSLAFARTFSKRMRRILASIRIIREGDYSHKVDMGGHDELTYLGNEFNDLTDRLQDSVRTQRQFVSDASHELKTPLASIKLLSDSILQNDMDPETLREFVMDIGEEADRLTRMSDKLLSLTRADSNDGSNCEIVYMAPTIERVMRMLSATAKKKRITLSAQLEDDCPILMMDDDLYQITFNLVENGIKYNVTGGSLTVSLHREEDNAVMQISDTGVGIPENSINHIFERFYRVDKARSRQSGGSGLGLAIVRDMVLRNRGEIEVESTLGAGTVFTVKFPAFDLEDAE